MFFFLKHSVDSIYIFISFQYKSRWTGMVLFLLSFSLSFACAFICYRCSCYSIPTINTVTISGRHICLL